MTDQHQRPGKPGISFEIQPETVIQPAEPNVLASVRHENPEQRKQKQ
jgi:hypothetical protein